MNQIVVYCGNWKFIPFEIKNTVQVISQLYQTGEEMSEIGQSLFDEDIENGYDRRVFTNNEQAFIGIRLAVKKKGLKAAERLSFIYYDKTGRAHRIKLDADGNLGYGVPHDGFFDQTCKDLVQLL